MYDLFFGIKHLTNKSNTNFLDNFQLKCFYNIKYLNLFSMLCKVPYYIIFLGFREYIFF